ncbi:MAG TPA: TlpA disulfide reductase family protein [Devosiaceae bacterium]|jgi:thiol-disulfide isomerase/thioredoxin|nr:TlpA disulfide reductase family protein [Devosiaceae bacterium]
MTDQQPARPPRLQPRRLMVLAGASAAVALAITLYVGNSGAPQASECPVQAEAAAGIDRVAIGELAALNGTGEGRGYADLAFTDAAGNPLTIADFAGKKLLINFWASWCVPCREEMPALDAVATRYNADDFMVLPINLDMGEDGAAKARNFLEEGQFANLPLYADASFEAFERLKREAVAIGLPATLLVDEAGCELAVLQGPAEWDSPDGHNVVEALLAV